MKQLISIVLLLIAHISYSSAIRLDQQLLPSPLDTIFKINGEQIICEIKVYGESEILYEKDGKKIRIRKKSIDHVHEEGGKITYLNSTTHENKSYVKNEKGPVQNKNNTFNILTVILVFLGVAAITTGIILLIDFLTIF